MSDVFTSAAEYTRGLSDFCCGLNQTQQEQSPQNQPPEPDFLCACNGKACDGVCREKSGHFRGGDRESGGCTAAYRPPKPKVVRRDHSSGS